MNTSKDILWSQGSANGGTFWDAGVRGYGFSINSSRIVTFDQNGNVGIGTTSPSQKLHVKGNTLIENGADTTSTVRNAGVLLWTDSAYGMQLHHDGTSWGTAIFARSSDSDVRLGHYAGGATAQNTFTSSLVVKNTGNVGINTSSPTNRLQVVGGVTATSFTGSFSGSITAPGSSNNVIYNSSGVLAGSNSFVFTGTSVGIGTTAPVAKLHSYGTGWTNNASGSGLLRLSATDNFPTITFAHTNTPKWSLYVGGAGSWVGTGNIGFVTHDGTEDATRVKLMIASGSGNVGIGTTSPGATLDVEGNLLIRNAQFEATSSATSGATTLATIATGSYKAVFVDYIALSGSNQRAGTFMGTWNSSTVQYTDYSTVDIGTTSAVTMSVSISGGNALVQATTPASWTVTATYRTI